MENETSDTVPPEAGKEIADQSGATFIEPLRGQVSVLWHALKTIHRDPEMDFLNADEVDNNDTGIPCPRHSAVSAEIPGDNKKVHANYVRFAPPASAPSLKPEGTTYIAGQAPNQPGAFERLLFKGIASRQGIFQIVSERAQLALGRTLPGDDADRTSKSVIEQLNESLAKNPDLTIGNRFKVSTLDCQIAGPSSSVYLLTVTDTHANDEVIVIPLTQAGLKFEDRVLKVPDIVSAKKQLDDHLTFGLMLNPQVAVEPIIISAAGVGRNATLMVYRHIESLIENLDITTEEQLHQALEREIRIGRAARGPHFVHSEAQLEQLHAALLELLLRQRGSPQRTVFPDDGRSTFNGTPAF